MTNGAGLRTRLTGGKPNSLGDVPQVVAEILVDPQLLPDLYDCLFSDDQWVRMRAGDALEKVCRVHPDWFIPCVPKLLGEVAEINQASVKWHLAQMLGEIDLTDAQRVRAVSILTTNLADPNVDWIVASHCMETLSQFAKDGSVSVESVRPLIEKQLEHRSKAVGKRARKLLAQLPIDGEADDELHS
jgi:hypothetical protein